MTFEITEIIKSKHAYRALLAARPLAEELRMLEELRKRAISIRESRRELPGKSDLSLKMGEQFALHCFAKSAKV